MLKALLNILALSFVCFLAAGCTTSVKTNISTVHKLPSEPNGDQIAVYPVDGKARSVAEYDTYSTMLSYYLVKTGFTIVPISQQPKLVASLDYGVDHQKTAVTALPATFAKTESNANLIINAVANASGADSNAASQNRSGETKYVELSIARFEGGRFVPVYQSRLITQGVCGNLNAAMPELLGKLFKDFPRESGTITTVTEPAVESC